MNSSLFCDENTQVKTAIDWAQTNIAKASNLRFHAPSLEARLLFEFATNKNHSWQIAYANDSVLSHFEASQIETFQTAVTMRLQGKPIAFILGTQDFWTLRLQVSDCTLIPRHDTEILVEEALKLPLSNSAKVLDLGTGSGAIALALKKERTTWLVSGVDFIAEAVALAQQNAENNNLRVQFLESDWFEVFVNNEKFDLIVSNPPYVESTSEYVKQGDLRFEPLSALVSGLDGLDDIRHIVAHAKAYLQTNAYLMIEHGHEQGPAVQSLLCEHGYKNIETKNDLNNLPRISLGKWFKSHKY